MKKSKNKKIQNNSDTIVPELVKYFVLDQKRKAAIKKWRRDYQRTYRKENGYY